MQEAAHWGAGRAVVFSHGWPLSSEACYGQLRLVAENGFRGITHDRRGHGHSGHDGLAGESEEAFNADLLAFLND